MALGTSDPLIDAVEEPDSKYTRLHITPLNPTLLPSILHPALRNTARNISYHSLQTFPEKEFGFIDLPDMEAQMIKRKLNGSILRGEKIKIEDARPSKKPADVDSNVRSIVQAHPEKQSKKRKRDTEALQGIELRGRKVKRGWTDPKASKKTDKRSKGKKDGVKSKYTSGPELLFKTILPANKAASALNIPISKVDRKNTTKGTKEVIIHEFSKTMKHASFLRSSGVMSTAKGVVGYVENKGWVDASGNIVEAPVRKSKKAPTSEAEGESDSSVSTEVDYEDKETESDKTTEEETKKSTKSNKDIVVDDSFTSSSGMSSEEDDEMDGRVSSSSQSADEETRVLRRSPKTPPSLRIGIPNTSDFTNPESTPTVHPLEALFKRRRPNLEAPIIPDAVPSFSFFDVDGNDEEENDVVDSIPMTPFTKQDFALRGLRSAAPTPDTAFPSKSHIVWPTAKSSKEPSTDLDGEATPIQSRKGKEAKPQKDSTDEAISDFQKWFYENRGENNRAWKKRRRMAAKEKRHGENKKRNERSN